MASWSTYLQAVIYIALLFFMIPIRINGPDEVELQFLNYLKNFNKSYDASNYDQRLEAFKKSLQMIEKLNNSTTKTNQSATYGLTKYSDLLAEEFISKHLQADLSDRLLAHHTKHQKRSTVPEKIDWRQRHVVGSIRDQGGCGACWAYSTMGAIESLYAIKYNKSVNLKVEQIINCASTNDGCKGGDFCNLISWLNSTKFSLSPNYSNNCTVDGVQIEDFMCENLVGLEDVILKILSEYGPVIVAVDAKTWQNYIGGVIEYHCDGSQESLNHAVQIVGYDLTAPIPHYIVRNSWGPDFGDHGYLYLAIGNNTCGLANEVAALKIL